MQRREAASDRRYSGSRLVVVAGAGRSGTSTLAGLLNHLGVWVPEPHIRPNSTNPKGFYESAWVVRFHKRLLDEAAVPQYDARPAAFDLTAEIGSQPAVRDELRRWLSAQFGRSAEVLIKDPRDAWFLPLWCSIARDLGASPGVVMTVRHPAEVVGSYSHHYLKNREPQPLDGTNRTGNWINLTLETEYATRSLPRTFVRYADVLSDWRLAAQRIGEALDLSFSRGIAPEAAAAVDAFIDPSLHRIQATWDNVDAPRTIIDLAEAVWLQMTLLIDGGDIDATRASLDALRDDYRRLYAESAEIARSSIRAAYASGAKEALAEQNSAAGDRPVAAPGRPAAAPRRAGRVRAILRSGVRTVQAMAKRDG